MSVVVNYIENNIPELVEKLSRYIVNDLFSYIHEKKYKALQIVLHFISILRIDEINDKNTNECRV